MNQPIIPTHARIGVCALCNYNDWVVYENHFSGRDICVDTAECAQRQAWSHDTEVRANLITEIRTLCANHLFGGWGFVRAEGVTPWEGECARCAEARAEQEDEMAWERSGFTRDDFTIGEGQEQEDRQPWHWHTFADVLRVYEQNCDHGSPSDVEWWMNCLPPFVATLLHEHEAGRLSLEICEARYFCTCDGCTDATRMEFMAQAEREPF